MTTSTAVPKIVLAPREKEILEGLAHGSPLSEVAQNLGIRPGTASSYLKHAKRKLHGVGENAAALAVAYATGTLEEPAPLDPSLLSLTRDQKELLPLIAQGKPATEMASILRRPVEVVRRDARELMLALRARNPAHIVTQAWAYRLLRAGQVLAWLP